MEVTAKLRYLRMSPRKVRLVADMVRGATVEKASALLGFDPHPCARDLKKLIASAVANAKHNHQLDENNLFVKIIKVDMGPSFKRFFPRAHGRAAPIRRRTSHVTVVLAEHVERKAQISKVKAQKQKAPQDGTKK